MSFSVSYILGCGLALLIADSIFVYCFCRIILKAKAVLDLALRLQPIVKFMTWLPAPRLEKLVGWFTDDVRQSPNDTAHCVRFECEGYQLSFGWIRLHIDFNSLPIPAFREVDCSAFGNHLASSDILPPPMNASVKTTSVYRIASCGSRPARRF